MSKIFGVNPPNTNLRKNVFDLSEKRLYTCSAGQLIPVMCKECNPGEKFKISMASFTRSMPLNTAAFVRSRQYFHFFFVPFKQLWSYWDNFINGVDYRFSALQKVNIPTRIPALDLANAFYEFDNWLSIQQESEADYADPNFNWADYYQRQSPKDINGYPLAYGASRLLDMLGYGFRIHVDSKEFNSFSDYYDYVTKNINKFNNNALKIKEEMSGLADNGVNRKVNPFRILAYQKIYSDFYKRDDYEATRPQVFNIDDFDGSTDLNVTTLKRERLLEMFQLRYRWLPKDYFTGVVPSELYGVEGVGKSLASMSGHSFNINGTIVKMSVENNDKPAEVLASTDGNVVSTKSIRASFALEKLLRLTRRASGQDYISQTAAHYGFTPPKGRGDKVQFLGGFSNMINVSDVVATASTSEAVTGQTFGQGIGSMEVGQDIDFVVPEHGVIMCIQSIVPELDYACEGMDRFNSKFTRMDYFHPEFQDMGLQPIYESELINALSANKIVGTKKDTNGILGYAPMYSEYKTSFDKLHGEFRNTEDSSLSAWSASSQVQPDFSSRKRSGVKISSLIVNPSSLDRIYSVRFNGDTSTDQFMVSSQFIVKAIRSMTITGQNL